MTRLIVLSALCIVVLILGGGTLWLAESKMAPATQHIEQPLTNDHSAH